MSQASKGENGSFLDKEVGPEMSEAARAARPWTPGVVEGRPGLDISSLVKSVLGEEGQREPSYLSHRLNSMLPRTIESTPAGGQGLDTYGRLFATGTGRRAAEAIGNESKTLDVLSSLAIEILLEYLDDPRGFSMASSGLGRRFLVVPGEPTDAPTLLVLDPTMADVSQSRRLTNEIDLDPHGIIAAFERMRPFLGRAIEERLFGIFAESNPESVLELLWISRPEVVLSRRPRMVPLCAPSPYLAVQCGAQVSTVGIFCHDDNGDLGVSACFHGTGPVNTAVTVNGIQFTVKLANVIQDLVFIPVGNDYKVPPLCGRGGVRSHRAPSQAEPVVFDGAGSQKNVPTRVQSHDSALLRRRPAVQLRVQTPADTNFGDSGAALIDEDDRVVAFAFERSGVGEFPEYTEWIWADNALSALGLKPI